MRRRKQPLPDYYAILGVSSSASVDEIKNAFRRLVKECHPDKFQSYADKNKNGEKVKAIIEAYQVLRNPQSRRQCDQERESLRVVPNKPPTDVHSAPASVKPSSQNSDWFLWVAGIATVALMAYMTYSLLPEDPLARPFSTVGRLLLYLPGMAIVAFIAVLMVMFLSLLVVGGVRYGLQVGTEDVQRDPSTLRKKFFTRTLVVFFVLMSFAYGYFEWKNPLLRIVAGIGAMILGYGFIFVPVLFGEFFALLYYVCFTRRTIVRANALAMQE